MKQPLVSILMPVYNSFDFVRSENNKLLPRALDSILNQTYGNIELIILDNQSTDDTPTICKQYAEKDSRIRYIVDSQKRYAEGGIGQAATFRKGAYAMIANDDDLWHPTYIEKMVTRLEAHPEADMCYSNGTFVDVQGNTVGPINTIGRCIYHHDNSPISNFSNYILNRNPIPLIFGLFRSEAYSKLLPFEDFDNLRANVDNLFLAKFFLLGLKCHYVDESLFFYRRKQRKLDPKKVSDMPGLEKPLEIWLYYLIHQYTFYKKIESKFDLLQPNKNQRIYLRAVSLHSFIMTSQRLIHWIRKDIIANTATDKEIAEKIGDHTNATVRKYISKFPQVGNFPDDAVDNVRFHEATLSLMITPLQTSLKALIDGVKMCISAKTDSRLGTELLQMLQKELSEIELILKDVSVALKAQPTILAPLATPRKLSSKPSLSVISASMNLGKFLDDTLRSVANQTTDDFEHIVVDGGSKDNTLSILKNYHHLRWISEKDSGYPEAFHKGLRMARGKYIIQCAVSDCLAHRAWLQKCIETLDNNPDIGLVWGFPERLTESSVPGTVSYAQFQQTLAPQKDSFFSYWLKTSFYLPEGNFCVRREIMEKCYPQLSEIKKNTLDWLEFNYNFHTNGYLAEHIPVIANYGRTHGNQMGEELTKNGRIWKMYRHYLRKVFLYRTKIMLGLTTPRFKKANGDPLPLLFDRKAFIGAYSSHVAHEIFSLDSRYLSPRKYKEYGLKKLRYVSDKIKRHLP